MGGACFISGLDKWEGLGITEYASFSLRVQNSAERETLLSWDRRIQGVCYQVNSIVDKINSAHHEWATSSLESQMSH